MKLDEYLNSASPQGFIPKPYYSPEGETLTFFSEDAEYYARRIDDLVTVYLSTDSDKLVGCKIKGVRRILNRIGEFGVYIDEEGNRYRLGPFFLALMLDAEEER